MRKVLIPYLSDEEMSRLSGKLIPGKGLFEIIAVEFGKAKGSGNDQFIIDFKIWDPATNQGTARDYFPLADNCLWKLKAFLASIGETYQKGYELDMDAIVGKTGACNLKMEKYTGNDGTQKESIRIGFYLPKAVNESIKQNSKEDVESIEDDEIPF